jgi:RNA polymerase sigma-70 factor (ECF subfamily)
MSMKANPGGRLPVDQESREAPNPEGGGDLQTRLLELYASARPALLSYIRQMVRSAAEAEDIVQSAFLKTFDQAAGQRIDNLRGWIYRVAHNLAIDALRRKAFHEQVVSEWVYTKPGETSTSAEQASINRQTVEQALQRLNERERACLLLRADGLSYCEIGEVLEISAKSVSVYLARAVKKVRNKP